MNESRRLYNALRGASVVCLGAGAMAIAEPPADAPPPAATTPSPVFLVLERAELGTLLADPKDQALANALAMLPDRVHELPNEIPDFREAPMPLIDLAMRLQARQARLAVRYDPMDPSRGFFGGGVLVSLGQASHEEASQTASTVGEMMKMANVPFQSTASTTYAEMSELASPMGPVRYGARQAKDGWRYEIHAGNTGDPDAVFDSLPAAPSGFTPIVRGRVDFASLSPLLGMLQGFASGSPEAQKGFEMASKSGIAGRDAIKYSFVVGRTADAMRSRSVVEGYRRFAAPNGETLPTLSDDEINAIPADAYSAGLTHVDLSGLPALLDEVSKTAPDVERGLSEFAAQTGVDLRNDVLASVGGTFGWYFSDTTGGGSLHSLVLLASLKDGARLNGATRKLESLANSMLESEAQGHVKVRCWEEEGVVLSTISFPGVPVPMDLTYAVTDHWLIVGMNAQGTLAAVRESRDGGGLLNNPAFKASLPSGKQFTCVSFVDSPRTMNAGYPFLVMAGAAVSNAMRSPGGAEREPGLVIPSFKDLARGAKPMVSCTYWDGEDLVSETVGDHSLLVNAAGVIGALEPVAPVVAAAVLGTATRQEAVRSDEARRAMMEAERAELEARARAEAERADAERRAEVDHRGANDDEAEALRALRAELEALREEVSRLKDDKPRN